jgi:hypothetical protein
LIALHWSAVPQTRPTLVVSYAWISSNKAKLHSNTPRFSIPNQTVHYQIFTCIYTDTCMPSSQTDISILPIFLKKTLMGNLKCSEGFLIVVPCPTYPYQAVKHEDLDIPSTPAVLLYLQIKDTIFYRHPWHSCSITLPPNKGHHILHTSASVQTPRL